ncbi:TonB-dependent receptor [Caulobacter hibisci]|uniref:TonB-dependent receptor n=1 Tax=Caulobacter hibisci TaxID=2035993 RepID=A0ABS0SXG8_9CAUL|nr:TonB-dependent receptor [Caulobacter hibisci]MBI1684293.1 TonB-dependent receptor [Caulobacter hibisci]
MKSHTALRLALLTTAALAPALPALAQTTETTAIEEVVVTAQKKTELASKTPIALTAYNGETLKAQGVVSVSDLQNVAPSVNIGRDGFGVNVNIRGVTTTDTTSKGEQGISFNVDGVAIGRPTVQGLSFFDVERVEVLRGPQGTLYGKSSTGGALNIITNKPKSQFEAGANLEFGNYNTRRADLVLNVPVNDKLALRAAINSNKRDGYIYPADGAEARNDEDNISARLSGLYEFNDDTSLLVSTTFGHVGGVGPAQIPYSNYLTKSGKAARTVYANPFGSATDEDFHNVNVEFKTAFKGVAVDYIGARHDFSANDLTSSTNDPYGNYSGPPPATPLYAWRQYRGDVTTDAHEVRLSNAESGRLDWVVGANWTREDITESDHNWYAPVSTPTLAASYNGIDPVNNTIHTSKGVFGQATFHATDRLNVTAGVRRSSDEVDRKGTFAAGPGPWPDANGGTCTAPEDCIGGANNGYQNASKTTYRLAVDYQVAPGQMVFASVATGYKAGGFNDFDASTGGTGTYAPESLTAYEVGYKGRPLSNLQINGTAFYYDYASAQVSSLVNISGNFIIYTRSAPVTIYGLELESKFKPTPNDQIDLAATFLHSEYEALYVGILQNVDWSGYRLDKTPKAALAGAYSHVFELSNGASVTARLSSKYSSGYVTSSFSDALQFKQKAFTRSDATLTYAAQDGRFTVGAFVKNIENDLQMLNAPSNFSATYADAANISVSEPRMYGVRFGVRY